MGQRHQIYVRLPKKDYGKDNPNTRGEKTIGIHHQWLFGRQALKMLKQYLEFTKAQDPQYREYDARGKLAACYSLLASESYYHNVYEFKDSEYESENDSKQDMFCLANPMLGDNNDGITIIDLSKPEIQYCFMNIHHIEATNGDHCPVLKPLSAIEYVTYYYPNWRKGLIETRGENSKLEPCPELKTEVEALEKFFSDFKVLSLARVKKIFPAMFAVAEKEKELKETFTVIKIPAKTFNQAFNKAVAKRGKK